MYFFRCAALIGHEIAQLLGRHPATPPSPLFQTRLGVSERPVVKSNKVNHNRPCVRAISTTNLIQRRQIPIRDQILIQPVQLSHLAFLEHEIKHARILDDSMTRNAFGNRDVTVLKTPSKHDLGWRSLNALGDLDECRVVESHGASEWCPGLKRQGRVS